jgi:hypothetical protein
VDALRLAGLAIAAVAVSMAMVLGAPKVRIPEGVADLLAVAITVLPALALLVGFERGQKSIVVRLIALGTSAAILITMSIVGLTRLWIPFQVTALLVGAHVIGSGLGNRTEHPGHMLPAAFVASAADLASVVSPEGPSHAALANETAISVMVLAAPVPGTQAITFVLGVGDLVFIALLLGVATRFSLRHLHVAGAVLVGLVIAFGASALLEAAIPALIPIGAAAVIGVPSFRKIRKKDRTVAIVGCSVAVAVGVWVVVRAKLMGG